MAPEQFCYLTTKGRVTGKAHTVEIWFAQGSGHTLYILSGGRDKADWVKNITNEPSVEVRLGGETFRGRGRVLADGPEDRLARELVVTKYYGASAVGTSKWGAESLPVAIDLEM